MVEVSSAPDALGVERSRSTSSAEMAIGWRAARRLLVREGRVPGGGNGGGFEVARPLAEEVEVEVGVGVDVVTGLFHGRTRCRPRFLGRGGGASSTHLYGSGASELVGTIAFTTETRRDMTRGLV